MNNKKLSCFAAHKAKNKSCQNKKCKFWHDLNSHNDCILNKVNENKDLTLQEIGDLFNITRMRVCQIEKAALLKMKKKNHLSAESENFTNSLE